MTSATYAASGHGRSMAYRRQAFAYLAISPAFLLVAAVSFVPLVYALVQSLHKSDYLELGQFVWFDNYARFLLGPQGRGRVLASLYFVVGTIVVSLPLGFGLALLLNRPIWFRGLFRTLLIIPWLVSALVGALLWMWLLNPAFSPLAQLVESLSGSKMVNPLTNPGLAMPAAIVAHSWSSYPMIMVFVLAALQTVPGELIEAARIDGANGWQRFRFVTFPYVKNTTLVALVLTTLNTFNHVTLLLVMTGGGPLGATDTLALRIFEEGFKFYRMGVASAGAVVVFATNVVFAVMYARILRGRGEI